MTQDPVLFTTFEWVLMSMAALFALLVFAYFYRDDPSYPFANRDEDWQRDTPPARHRHTDRK